MKIYAYTEKTINALVRKSEKKLKENPKYNELLNNSRLKYFQIDMLKENKEAPKSTDK